MNRRWVCNDVWLNILPFFNHAQLGLKLALLSYRYDSLVDKHFDGKPEFTVWRTIAFCRHIEAKPQLCVMVDGYFVQFPLPDHPLPNKIRFKRLFICYIDHSVIEFLRSNKQIWDRRGTRLELNVHQQPIWDVVVREIWPTFAANVRRLCFTDSDYLDTLRRCTSPTILTDLNRLDSIYVKNLLPDVLDDLDVTNATSAGQALSKWLHTPRKDGQPKRLFCNNCDEEEKYNWVNNFKEKFLSATTSTASYKIQFYVVHPPPASMVPFELMNEWSKEKLTLTKASKEKFEKRWIITRCQIGETAAVHWEDENWEHLNTVSVLLLNAKQCIGALSPTPTEEEEAGQSND